MNRRSVAMGVLACTLSVAATTADAREVDYDFTVCGHSRSTVLEAGADLVALSLEQWGIVASSTTKEWEGATTRCVGVLRMVAGKPIGKGLCRWVTRAGDTAIGEWEYPAAGEPVWTWLSGTGGLKGVSGRGGFRPAVEGRPAQEGTTQSCRRDWGRYVLP